jgi:hypothetical protein
MSAAQCSLVKLKPGNFCEPFFLAFTLRMRNLLVGSAFLLAPVVTVKVSPFIPQQQQYYYYAQPQPQLQLQPQLQPQQYYYAPMMPSYATVPQQQYVYAQQIPQQMPQMVMRASPQSLVGMTPPTLIPDPDAESQRLLQSGEVIEDFITTTTPLPTSSLPKNFLNLMGRSHHQPFPAAHVASAFEQSLHDAMNKAVSVLDTVPTFASTAESAKTEALVEAPRLVSATIPSWQELLGKEMQSGIFA